MVGLLLCGVKVILFPEIQYEYLVPSEMVIALPEVV